MKKLIRTFALLLTLLAGGVACAQLTIPGTGVTFQLNSEEWRYLRTFKAGDGGDVYVYCYTADVIRDMEGDTVLPFLRVYVNDSFDGDLLDLAYARYMVQPFQSLDEYTKGMGLPKSGGMGYIGAYTNPSDQKDYQFFMTYFRDHGVAVEFRLETTKDTFEEMESIFKEILGSLK